MGNAKSGAGVLVVEDDFLIADFIEAALADAGYAVGVAARADAALGLAEQDRPALAVVDIRLGNDDGVALAREMHARLGTPTVFLSGSTDPQTRSRAASVPGSFFLEKPFRIEQLVGVVQAALLQNPPRQPLRP